MIEREADQCRGEREFDSRHGAGGRSGQDCASRRQAAAARGVD